MSFEKYFKKVNEKWEEYRNSIPREKIKQQKRDRFYQIYMNYSLVKVTWILAIATILLSVLTLILK